MPNCLKLCVLESEKVSQLEVPAPMRPTLHRVTKPICIACLALIYWFEN